MDRACPAIGCVHATWSASHTPPGRTAWHSLGMPSHHTLCDLTLSIVQALGGRSLAEPEHAQPSVDWLRRNLEAVRTSSLPKDLDLDDTGEPLPHHSLCDEPPALCSCKYLSACQRIAT